MPKLDPSSLGCQVFGCPVPGCPVPGCPVPGCPVPGCPVPGCPVFIFPVRCSKLDLQCSKFAISSHFPVSKFQHFLPTFSSIGASPMNPNRLNHPNPKRKIQRYRSSPSQISSRIPNFAVPAFQHFLPTIGSIGASPMNPNRLTHPNPKRKDIQHRSEKIPTSKLKVGS